MDHEATRWPPAEKSTRADQGRTTHAETQKATMLAKQSTAAVLGDVHGRLHPLLVRVHRGMGCCGSATMGPARATCDGSVPHTVTPSTTATKQGLGARQASEDRSGRDAAGGGSGSVVLVR